MDKWFCGIVFILYYLEVVRSSNSFVPDDLYTNTVRPCNSFEQPKKPDFLKYNYRLSERKCLGYLWDMYNRLQEIERLKTCSASLPVLRGGDAKPAEYPHMGAVGWRSRDNSIRFLCGSSLISSKFVLTAAHCAESSDSELVSVAPSIIRFGNTIIENNDFSPIVDVNIENIIINPFYNPPSQYFDIALFKLDRELKFNKFVQPACIWSKSRVDNIQNKITVAGWGATDLDQLVLSSKLHVAEVKTIKTKRCNRLLKPFCNRNWCDVKSHQICAGNLEGGADTCYGDSGGPLQFSMVNTTDEGQISMIIGVTSLSMSARRCGDILTPGIYTKVYSFIDWIERQVWPGEN